MTKNKKKEIVLSLLFESFYDNKSINFVVKQDKKKDKRLKILLEYSYYLGNNFGDIYLNSKQTACAILIDSSKKRTNLKSILWNVKLLVLCIGLFNLPKVLKREKLIESKHPKFDFAHLWYIGVRIDKQGEGDGSKLMRLILEDQKRKGLPVYLETSTVRNFKFYEKLNFNLFDQITDLGYVLNMYLN